MIYVLDEQDVIDAYKKDKNKVKLKVFLTMIVFNLVAHGHLDTTFQVDDLINTLLSSSAESDKTILQTFIDIFSKEQTLYKPQIKELQEIIKYAGDTKLENQEKFATLLLKILDSSFAIKQVTPQKYTFLADKFIQGDSGLRQEKSKFDISFVNAALVLYNL
ncbi:hypothetical protein KKG31_01995 [Patescibacteria group bacterium]|nr:hypothetical protein [Patescibacteria group bacterium]MBU1757944.1 hypothetical protein [Patescibacteria group bacterium]